MQVFSHRAEDLGKQKSLSTLGNLTAPRMCAAGYPATTGPLAAIANRGSVHAQ
jgi:hypothetical protein